jgi:hypothetical protein
MPKRETCTNLPSLSVEPFAFWTWMLRRDVVLQTPTIGFSAALRPSASSSFGTCSAIVLTLKPASVSSPTSVRSAP